MIKDPFEKLMECHEEILGQISMFEAVLLDLEVHGMNAFRNHHESLTKTSEFVDTSVAMHMADEEKGLFPLLDPKLQPRVRRPHFNRTPIQAIEEQHRKGEEIIQRLRFLSKKLHKEIDQPGVDILLEEFIKKSRALIVFYREHIRGENEIIFPLAQKLLTEEEKAKVASIMETNRRASKS